MSGVHVFFGPCPSGPSRNEVLRGARGLTKERLEATYNPPAGSPLGRSPGFRNGYAAK